MNIVRSERRHYPLTLRYEYNARMKTLFNLMNIFRFSILKWMWRVELWTCIEEWPKSVLSGCKFCDRFHFWWKFMINTRRPSGIGVNVFLKIIFKNWMITRWNSVRNDAFFLVIKNVLSSWSSIQTTKSSKPVESPTQPLASCNISECRTIRDRLSSSSSETVGGHLLTVPEVEEKHTFQLLFRMWECLPY